MLVFWRKAGNKQNQGKGEARRGAARQGKAGQGKAWLGTVLCFYFSEKEKESNQGKGKAWLGLARQGKARRGMAGRGTVFFLKKKAGNYGWKKTQSKSLFLRRNKSGAAFHS
jgi:hypothetical protein